MGMAAVGTSSIKVLRNTRSLTEILTSSACEWFLIFLLFIDAILSYVLTKFARYCKLHTPCLLCSRLDHVLGNEKPEFYRSLFCNNHMSDISSLISCQIHGKLADGHSMCEDCLLSFATKNKPNSETHRLLVAKLGLDLGGYGFQSPLLNKDFISGSGSTKPCSCCSKPSSSRQNAQRFFHLKPPETVVTKPNVPLPPRIPGRTRFSRRDSLKRIRDKFYGSVTPNSLAKSGIDPLSDVGYTELKITSESESEVPFSDDDDDVSVVRDNSSIKGNTVVQHASENLPKTLSDELAPARLNRQSLNSRSSLLDPHVQPDISEPHDVKSLASNVVIEHGLGELRWPQADQKSNPPAGPEHISVTDIPSSSRVVEVPPGVSTDKLKFPVAQNSNSSALSELISFDDILPAFSVLEVLAGESLEKSVDVTGINDARSMEHGEVVTSISTTREGFKSNQALGDPAPSKLFLAVGGTGSNDARPMEHGEVVKSTSTTGAGFKSIQALGDPAPSKPNSVDPSDACKSAVDSFVTEKYAAKDPDKISEDTKLLPSQKYSAQGVDLSSNGTSPRVYSDRFQKSDSMGRNESGVESFSGSTVSEIEGESTVERLKRQVEYDQKCLSSLYKELEEERSAAAIAANQAMAMITRLQEEKAALHMEALQYLRMMEEQAEYDVEALEKANDLLAEKEKEIQDLEAELEFYRTELQDESMIENVYDDTCERKRGKVMVEGSSVRFLENGANVSFKLITAEPLLDSDKSKTVQNPTIEFDAEMLYISDCVKELESKLHQYWSNGPPEDIPNGVYSENVADGVNNQKEFSNNEKTEVAGQKEENSLSTQKDLAVSNGNLLVEEQVIASVGDNQLIRKEDNHLGSDEKNSSTCGTDLIVYNGKLSSVCETDLIALENEILDLNDRLEALEADRDFLEHALDTICNGTEGLNFIQDIAHHLQELRKIGLRRESQSLAIT